MELMKAQWSEVQNMPYMFFVETLEWKIKLEDEKRKKMDEKMSNKTSSTSVKNPMLKSAMRKIESHNTSSSGGKISGRR